MDHYSFVQGRAPPEIYPELVPSPFKKERQNERHIRLPLQHLRYFKKISPLINGLSAFCRNQPSKKGGVNQVSSIHLLSNFAIAVIPSSNNIVHISHTVFVAFFQDWSKSFFSICIIYYNSFIGYLLLLIHYNSQMQQWYDGLKMVWLETKPNEINWHFRAKLIFLYLF